MRIIGKIRCPQYVEWYGLINDLISNIENFECKGLKNLTEENEYKDFGIFHDSCYKYIISSNKIACGK